MTAGSAGVQMLAGLTVIVLGILAVAGNNSVTLSLVALLGARGHGGPDREHPDRAGLRLHAVAADVITALNGRLEG